MSNVQLTLSIRSSGRIEAQRNDDSEDSGRLDLDTLHASLAQMFAAWVRDERISDRSELALFGSLLHRALFGGSIEGFFDRALDAATSQGGRLRLQLSFDADLPGLPSLPWEFLYSPDRPNRAGFFLGTRNDVVVSRYMPLSIPAAKTLVPRDPPLRLLVAISAPDDLPPVLYKSMVETICKVEKQLAGRMVVDVLEEASLRALEDRLKSFRPHALHYIGHAEYSEDEGEGRVALLAPDANVARWYVDSIFAETFDHAGAVPSLVLLQACHGASTDYGHNFAGVATKLIRWRVQAVIAMQYEVTNLHAYHFGEQFYMSLAAGEAIDDATQSARRRLAGLTAGAANSRAFGTPVLYMRSRDGLIIPQK